MEEISKSASNHETMNSELDENNNNLIKVSENTDKKRKASRAETNGLKFQGVPLKIQNLDEELTVERIREEFSNFGTVVNVEIFNSDERKTPYAIIHFVSPAEAAFAISCMNGKVIITKTLSVTLFSQRARQRKASTPSMQMLGQMAFVCNQTKCLSSPSSNYSSPKISRAWTTGPMRKSSSVASFALLKQNVHRANSLT